ncbi:extracellular solute-binding protein [Methylovirgula sp. HY1]|uniref:extracellular solute-binding protein n=1 Tax=Methylovirgula sp. HY1 TaxID=2822761 RepID=UPI001C5BB056|nr:extracellular solute-binding protein [Methylovirgula sp. HY1]QXX76417.1 Oligopeptide-binding protein AppA [Methylovirgula sp. HY1]
MKFSAIRRLFPIFSTLLELGAAIVLGIATAQAAPRHSSTQSSNAATNGPQYAIAMHGRPALPETFTHFPYANPDAPKGGKLTIGLLGTFDSLNPFNLKAGSTAQGLIGNVFQTLMERSRDEPFTLYGSIAKTIETDPDRSYAIFHLDPRAHFSDGTPITSADILFSFELLRKKGRPQQRAAYALIKHVETPDAETIRFDFPGIDDREMPLTLALMPVLSPHFFNSTTFDNASLAIPVGSGPYRVADVDAGQKLILRRDKNFWGKDLPVNRGRFNFDEIEIDYYRDANALFQAFRAGLLDFRTETNPVLWTTAYDFPSLRDHRVWRASLPIGGPKGMEGFVFNLRRPMFDDIRVREALGMMFDFQWINANFFSGLYTRTKSFFDDSELASTGRPASAAERALLAPFPGAVRPDILAGRWAPPKTDVSGLGRIWPKRALKLLAAAGYELKGEHLVDKTGAPFRFEIMVQSRAQERLALAYAASLARIGIDAKVRAVDAVQYQRRRQNFDFDMMIGTWLASASPGNEQRGRWGSVSANQQGSYNLAGVKSPAVDAMIDALLAARTQAEFVTAVRAYDRVLLSGFYIVPLFHASYQWIAASAELGRPDKTPAYGPPTGDVTLDTWWRKPK